MSSKRKPTYSRTAALASARAVPPVVDGGPGFAALSDLLHAAGHRLSVTPGETLTSAVTTGWGVAWSEEMIARDLLQNFFDANREALDRVQTRTWEAGVQVSAPAAFDLNRLFFLGSEKGSGDVGQYGEGFKAAALCLLRDHGVQPICLSGKRGVVLSVSDDPVADTGLRPVLYRFFDISPGVPGTVLLLPTRSAQLRHAVEHGLDDFLHEGNPVLGELLFEAEDLALHRSRDGQGHLFYRQLRRCLVPAYPLVWVMRGPIATVERRTAQDRDRKAFGDEVRTFFLRGWFQQAMRRNWIGWTEACEALVVAGRVHWERGHPVLAELAQQLQGLGTRGDSLRRLLGAQFEKRYYARQGQRHHEMAHQMAVERVEKSWRDDGRKPLPSYFQHLGADHAEAELERRAEAALRAARAETCRAPTSSEKACLDLLAEVLRDFAPDIAAVFARKGCRYTVGSDETLLGQLRRDRGYRSTEVYLDASVFVQDLAHAAATHLHEHAHIFGWDGSRGFTDALTEMLETVLREHEQLAPHEQRWKPLAQAVRRERQRSAHPDGGTQTLSLDLGSLGADEMRALLAAMPAAVLQRARRALAGPK